MRQLIRISMWLFLIVIIFLLGCQKGRGFRYAYGGNYIGCRPSMSPDGSLIVFGSIRHGNGDICIIDSIGSNWRCLTDTSSYEGEPAFSPDGKKIAFISERDDGHTGHVYIMNIDGLGQKRLTSSKRYDSSPSFSPDGKNIAFNRLFGNYNYEIFIINIDGSGEKRLTYDEEEEAYPEFSSDGEKIVYRRPDGIWRMNLDGSDQELFMEETNECGKYVFSPDGSKIACLSSKGTDYKVNPYTIMEIYIMNRDGSGLRQITNTKNYNSEHTFTPDGNSILFFEFEREGRGKGQIRIVNIDGSGLRTISPNY